jgi:hypothetical protein
VSFNEIWHAESQRAWNELLKKYWSLVSVDNIQVEYRMNRLTRQDLEAMDEVQWYHFLHDEYFVWKYTAKNRLASTRLHLRKYQEEHDLGRLDNIRRQIVQLDPDAIRVALNTAFGIRGLGVAGASGLLSLVYPGKFATVDQFVVKALLEVPDHHDKVRRMNPKNLTLEDGVVLTEVMREKASVMNETFHSTFWTPRTVEMALWAYRPQ